MTPENFDIRMRDIIRRLPEGQPARMLLHSCCGPCSSAVLERLCPFFDVAVFYYDPNIHPRAEYDRRAAEQARLLEEMRPAGKRVKLLTGEYDDGAWFEAVRGLEAEKEGGARCRICFRMRLERTARAAKSGGFDFFTTTLTVSPHKNAPVVNEEGCRASEIWGVPYLPADFKKRGGYQRSLELSRLFGLYRQNYCGCVYSEREREETCQHSIIQQTPEILPRQS